MSAGWAVVITVGLATVLIKGLGPLIVGGTHLPPRLLRVVALLGPALLAALVITQVVGAPTGVVFDERLLGVGGAAAALMLRAPALVAVIIASAVTALVRLMG